MTGILAFGAGIAVGALIASSDGWGSNNWNCNWHGGNVTYNKNIYVSNSNNYRALEPEQRQLEQKQQLG